jgi:hypothetical protein
MEESPLHITQHKRFVPFGTHPNFFFARTSFMLEPLYAYWSLKIPLESERWVIGVRSIFLT